MNWQTLKHCLQDHVSKSEYQLWIQPLNCLHLDNNKIILTCPDRFFCSWVADKYKTLIADQIRATGCAVPEIVFQPEDMQVQQPKQQLNLPGVAVGGSSFRSLHPRYTFDQFTTGTSNQLASSACEALAMDDTAYGSCLYINSTTGLGKSHLTQAVAHTVLSQSPATRLQYLTAQQFSAEMVRNLKAGTMDSFNNKYRHGCDILLVEDVHSLKGKIKTQEELNNILDYLIRTDKRIILTSALSPRKLDGIDPDFRSRMTAGLITEISAPDLQTRKGIISIKAAANNILLEQDHITLLAQHLRDDVRRIENAVIAIKARSNLLRTSITSQLIMDVLSGIVSLDTTITGDTILSLISNQFRINQEELQSRSRRKQVSVPRQIAMYLTRKHTNLSLADIGALYNRDHSTVLYAIRKVTKDISRQPSSREQVELLSNKLQEQATND